MRETQSAQRINVSFSLGWGTNKAINNKVGEKVGRAPSYLTRD